MSWMSILKTLVTSAPAIISAAGSLFSNSQDDRKIKEALELAEKYRNDTQRLMEHQTKLMEAVMLILERMSSGGYPQLPPGGHPQLWPGGHPQLWPGGHPQLWPGGHPQLPPAGEQSQLAKEEPKKIRIEMNLPVDSAERDEALKMFWRTMGNYAAANRDLERQQRTPRRHRQETTQEDSTLCCDICSQKYNEKKRLPKVLKCRHTFCQNCIKLRRKQSLECPVCRKISADPLNDLPTNYEILKLVPQHDAGSKERYTMGSSAHLDSSDDEAAGPSKTYLMGATALSDSSDEDDVGFKKKSVARDRFLAEFSEVAREEKERMMRKEEEMLETAKALSLSDANHKKKPQMMTTEEEEDLAYCIALAEADANHKKKPQMMTTEEEEDLAYCIALAEAQSMCPNEDEEVDLATALSLSMRDTDYEH